MARVLAPEVDSQIVSNRFVELHAGLRLLLVLEVGGLVAGTVSLSPGADEDGKTRRLFALDVGAGYRRRGYGSLLVGVVEKRIAADGHSIVRLEVMIENAPALRLYEMLGYVRVGGPVTSTWSRGVDGHPSEQVTETCYRMHKVLE